MPKKENKLLKRIICFILSTVLLCLTSCENLFFQISKTESASSADLVEQQIADLPSPRYDENEDSFIICLEKVEKNYAELSDEEKCKVKNYDRLLLAREIYNFDWIKSKGKQKIKDHVLGKFLDQSSLKIRFFHTYLYKFEEKIYVLIIFDYATPNAEGIYEEKSETFYYLFLPNQENVGYDNGIEMDYDTYHQSVIGATYYRRPIWR